MDNETAAPARRISSIVLIVILVVFALSISALYFAVDTYLNNPADVQIGYFLLIGFVGLTLSTYMLFQTRRGMKRRYTLKMQPITTTILCTKCDFKNVRSFERGDYILKKAEQCPKCKEDTLMSAIYREVKEKAKEEKVFT